jgi:hypothetical protein
MSTKINVRSPFYINITEPTEPTIELTTALINAQGFAVDEYGNITLPVLDFGTITSYTSSAGDFSNGKFAAVGTDTSRTVVFTILVPPKFSNGGSNVDVSLTATQPATACTGGVTNNGSIPNQAVDTQGGTATVNLASFFTSSNPITSFNITNNFLDFFTHSLSGSTLQIIGKQRAGVKTFTVEASDGVSANCKATQTIQVTTTAQETYTCSDAFFSGGSITQAGVITNPTVNGTITAIKDSSGGSTITSYPANSTGSDRTVTLFFDITIPTGYSNTGSTIECSTTFNQPTSVLPTFDCTVASLTNQAISSSGAINKGIANVGTISDFTPIGFDSSVGVDTQRTVTFKITPPSSGYSNSGGSDISCDITLLQPALQPTAGSITYYTGGRSFTFITKAQYQAHDSSVTTLELNQNTLEGMLETEGLGDPKQKILQKAAVPLLLQSATETSLVNTYAFLFRGGGNPLLFNTRIPNNDNPTGGRYIRIDKTKEVGSFISPAFQLTSHFVKLETNGLITEVWFIDYYASTFTKIA